MITRHEYNDGQVEIRIEEFPDAPTPGISVTIAGVHVVITRQVGPTNEEEEAITVWIDTDENPTTEVLRVRLNESDLHN